MDEDIRLINNEILKNHGITLNKEGINITKSKQSPWRKFEHFLLDYRPAIADVDNINHYNKLMPYLSLKKDRPPYLSSFLFDAMFNAFHKDVLDVLLPYDADLDLESWWSAQQYMQCKVFFRYHAQVIIFLPVIGVNTQHSKYPRGLVEPRKVCAKELKLAPKHIRTSNITTTLLAHSIIGKIHALNYIAPARTPMEPYKYFGNCWKLKGNKI